MAERTTRKELDQLAMMIDGRLYGWVETGHPNGNRPVARDYFVQYAYGQPRLMRKGGSVEVSPRLPAGQLALWMRAFLAGMDASWRGPMPKGSR